MVSLLLIGPPGAGKGTQKNILLQKYSFGSITPGDLVRAEMEMKTERGLKLMSLVNKGFLAPYELIISIVKEKIEYYYNNNIHNLIFDGFPREMEQAKGIDKILSRYNHIYDIKCVILFEVPDDVLVKRIRDRSVISGREDDKDDDVIRTRLEVYHDKIHNIIEKYDDIGILHRVEGDKNKDLVAKEVDDIVKKYMLSYNGEC